MAGSTDGAVPSLAVPRLRLKWADHHLELLEKAARDFRDSDPYDFPLEKEADGWHVWRLAVLKPPPPELGLIFGDWLHNIRSALDNLIVPLIELAGHTPGKRRSFPIFDKANSFKAVGKNRISGVRDKHFAMIEGLQPYPGRDDPRILALKVIDQFSNIDKHSTVHPALAGGHRAEKVSATLHGAPNDIVIESRYTGYGKRLDHGTEVARAKFTSGRPLPDMEVEGEFPVEIAFGERGLFASTLPTLRRHVGTVIESFAPDFEQ
jgi:hypothetical protein